jgi:C1A family cysteine protease
MKKIIEVLLTIFLTILIIIWAASCKKNLKVQQEKPVIVFGATPIDPVQMAKVPVLMSMEYLRGKPPVKHHPKDTVVINPPDTVIVTPPDTTIVTPPDTTIIDTTIITPPPVFPSSFKVALPPVQHQGSEGSCTAFATAYYTLSPYWYYKTGATSYSNSINVFSPEYVYDQRGTTSCSSGSSIITAMNFLTSNGDVLWSTLPYSWSNGCVITPTASQIAEAAQYKIPGYSAVYSSDIVTIKTLLLKGRVLNFQFGADYNYIYGRDYDYTKDANTQNFSYAINNNYVWKSYSPVVYGAHANALVGWDDSKGWLIVNQWGTNWGDAGYRWVDYNFLSTQVTHQLLAIN